MRLIESLGRYIFMTVLAVIAIVAMVHYLTYAFEQTSNNLMHLGNNWPVGSSPVK